MDSEMTSLPTLSHRLKLKKPLDVWSTREKLCLASAVFKIGDQNWVSVSRTIKPYADPNRPADWFHQKNCLLQYYDMMEQLEQPKRKRGSEKCESESASLQIMRNMTIERSEQLKKEILDMQQAFKTLKSEVEAIKAGQWDDKIKDVWEEIQEELKANEKKVKLEMKSEDEDDELKTDINLDIPSVDLNDSKQEPLHDISTLIDEELQQLTELENTASTAPTSSTEVHHPIEITAKMPAASHLLSSLLQSDVKTATGLQKLKNEQEQVQSQSQLSTVQEVTKSAFKPVIVPDESKIVAEVPQSISKSDTVISCPSVDDNDMEDDLDELIALAGELASETPEVFSEQEVLSSSQVEETLDISVKEEIITLSQGVENFEKKNQDLAEIKEEQSVNSSIGQMVANQSIQDEPEKEETETPMKKTVEATVSETDLQESFVKDDAPSPTSSICSRVSEPGSSRRGRRGRPRSSKSAQSSVKKSSIEEDKKVVVSDVDSDEDLRSDDLLTGQLTSINAMSVLSESFPNSPASMSICSDTEEEKSLKQWKKSIMLVWRAAATHKYANVFLHPVTDEIAPGYRSVVHRPMDLSTIKKNVEMGSIRTTVEFQRDMMLMFTNAIMYNSINHDVYKMAKEMYDDVMLHIEQYVNTQLMIQTTDAKNLRQSRRTDTSDKEDDVKKRRLSVDQSEGGKIKKRKTRLDESMSKQD